MTPVVLVGGPLDGKRMDVDELPGESVSFAEKRLGADGWHLGPEMRYKIDRSPFVGGRYRAVYVTVA